MSKIKILIVEDEAISALSLQQLLKTRGYSVEAIENTGENILKILQESETEPDLILMDIILTGKLDGIETATIIKQQYDIPIIFLTAHTDEKTLARAQQTEPNAYIVKPINPIELYTNIEITLQKHKLEKQLKKSEEKFSKAFLNNPTMLTITELETGTIIEVNESFLNTLGYSRNEVIGKSLIQLRIYVDPDDRKTWVKNLSETSSIKNFELNFRTKDGQIKLCSLSGEIMYIDNNKHIISMMEDITEKRQLETELSTIIENERYRIGRDLHDDLGQVLTGVTFLVQSLKQELAQNYLPGIAELEKVDNLVRNAVTKTRNISKILSPVEIDQSGLIPALEDMAHQIENVFSVTCNLEYSEEIIIQDSHITTNLYYIIREAINNAIKHGAADKIDIEFQLDNGTLNIAINDNGKSEQKQLSHEGMGLRIMKYRANLIRAKINYTFRKRGFSINLSLKI